MATRRQPTRMGIRAAVLGLSTALTVASSVGAQDAPAAEAASTEAPVSNRLSVRIASGLDNDPELIYRLVADHVRYEPYSGLLRGPAGALAGLAGNSVDQSLLLAGLLDAAGIDTRLAVGTIDEAVAGELLRSAETDPAADREHVASALYGSLPFTPGETPEVPTAAGYAVAYEASQSSEVDAWTREQVVSSLETIEAAMNAAGIEIEGGYATVPRDEISDHTWVQAEIDGRWVDLDPSRPGQPFGEALTEAAASMDAIPDERVHSIEIAVVSETLEDDQLVTDRASLYADPAHVIAGEPIVITNLGSDGVPALQSAFEGVLDLDGYHPIASVGSAAGAGERMFFPEDADDGDGLGGGFFGGGDAVAPTTAQWIELTIASPGVDPTTVRRAVFDRVPPELRASGAVSAADLAELPAVDLDGDGSLELAPLHQVTWLSVSTGVPSLYSPVIGLGQDDARALAIRPWTHHFLDVITGLDTAASLGVRPFVDAPNVMGFVASIEPTGDDTFDVTGALDIWHRSRGSVPVDGVAGHPQAAAVPGVLSHVTERLQAGDAAGSKGRVSVGAVFEAAHDAGLGINVVAAGDEVAELPYPPQVLDRLTSSIDQGWVAVVPERPVSIDGQERLGWWLVDPVTGRVSDQLADGRGGLAETILELEPAKALVIVAVLLVGYLWLGSGDEEQGAAQDQQAQGQGWSEIAELIEQLGSVDGD